MDNATTSKRETFEQRIKADGVRRRLALGHRLASQLPIQVDDDPRTQVHSVFPEPPARGGMVAQYE